jgi:hypothetical protein
MPPNLRDVTRAFARGEATLATLRGAARAERMDRHLADAILKLIADWETGARTDSARSRNELRDRAKRLVPSAPAVASRPDATTAMYEAS